jgi:Putative mono-oxygenase ydhR
MITVLVQFKLPTKLTPEQAEQRFSAIADQFTKIPGLVRKYFLLSDDGQTAGGVYLWETRSHAQRFYTDDFRQMILERYGSAPTITYFESPVIVEGLALQTTDAKGEV